MVMSMRRKEEEGRRRETRECRIYLAQTGRTPPPKTFTRRLSRTYSGASMTILFEYRAIHDYRMAY